MNSSNKPPTIDGWNDPPANLALSDNMSTKRVLLNKRVPYTNQDLTLVNNRIKSQIYLYIFHIILRFILASNVLTAPPPCLSSSISTSTPSDNDLSLKSDLLTIEEINEIFKNQIKKLEESLNIEV